MGRILKLYSKLKKYSVSGTVTPMTGLELALEEDANAATEVVDVAIVGFGPVGQALAGWLGQAGHRVAAFERYEEIYRLPRAVHLDGEVMRLLQSLGVVDELIDDMLPFRDYHWFGADGEPLMTLEATTPSRSGWEPDYLFFQPSLEQALDAHARSLPGVTVERGWVADGIESDDDGVALSLRPFPRSAGEAGRQQEARTVRARWVVGADGANSFVRDAVGIGRRDLGFEERWLVVDVEPDDPEALDLPRACQWCDPRRPVTHVQSGRGHRRWEFMLLPDETEADFGDEARVWELLAPWFTPADGRLTRHAVYEFRSILAERMREGRVLLAGDAAPPDATVPRAGALLRAPRRRQHRLEARPRPPRRSARVTARQRRPRAPGPERVGDQLRGRARPRPLRASIPTRPPSVTRPCGGSRPRRRSSWRRSARARPAGGTRATRSPADSRPRPASRVAPTRACSMT